MRVFTIDLYDYFKLARPENAKAILTGYVLEPYPDYCQNRTRPAMLVIPGGGYGHVSNREKEPMALKFVSESFNAFTLEYSVSPVGHPAQLIEACMAMLYIRENAKELHVIPDKISAIGFSAGGHLCSMLATMFDDDAVKKVFGDKYLLCRPDAVILSYPVITSGEGVTHGGSFNVLAGDNKELRDSLSTENRVKENTPPAFIWATFTDNAVPVENSLLMANAYRKAGIPFELHVYSHGPHGLSLVNLETACIGREDHVDTAIQTWFNLAITWLKKNGFELQNNEQE